MPATEMVAPKAPAQALSSDRALTSRRRCCCHSEGWARRASCSPAQPSVCPLSFPQRKRPHPPDELTLASQAVPTTWRKRRCVSVQPARMGVTLTSQNDILMSYLSP